MSERVDRATLLREVGERLMSARVADGLEVADVVKETEIDAERLESAEAGELALDEDELADLADLYGVEVTVFFGGRRTPIEYLFGA